MNYSEIMFWGGIGIMGITVVLTIFSILFFRIAKKRLNSKLLCDYGELEG